MNDTFLEKYRYLFSKDWPIKRLTREITEIETGISICSCCGQEQTWQEFHTPLCFVERVICQCGVFVSVTFEEDQPFSVYKMLEQVGILHEHSNV